MHRFHRNLIALVFLTLFIYLPVFADGISAVDETTCQQMKAHGVLKPGAPVDCHRLRTVHFSYLDFDGQLQHDGEIMVLDAAADHVLRIFTRLREQGFRIKQAKLMQHYDSDDASAMEDNNTSGFNYRPITNGTLPSLHAYGLAIDLNPLQNPYIAFNEKGHAAFSPAAGIDYANRLRKRPGKPQRQGMAEEAVQIFEEHGFAVWGGYWDSPIDYQHFQVHRRLAERLVSLPAHEARQLFERYVNRYRLCKQDSLLARQVAGVAPDCASKSIR